MAGKKDIQDESLDMLFYFKEHLKKTGRYEFFAKNLREQQQIANAGKGEMLELQIRDVSLQDKAGNTLYYAVLLFPRMKRNSYDLAKNKLGTYFSKGVYTMLVLNEKDPQSLRRVGIAGDGLQKKGQLSNSYSTKNLFDIITINKIEQHLSLPYNLSSGHKGGFIQYYQPEKTRTKEGLRSYILEPVQTQHHMDNPNYKFAQELDFKITPPRLINGETEKNQFTLSSTPLIILPEQFNPGKRAGKIFPLYDQ